MTSGTASRIGQQPATLLDFAIFTRLPQHHGCSGFMSRHVVQLPSLALRKGAMACAGQDQVGASRQRYQAARKNRLGQHNTLTSLDQLSKRCLTITRNHTSVLWPSCTAIHCLVPHYISQQYPHWHSILHCMRTQLSVNICQGVPHGAVAPRHKFRQRSQYRARHGWLIRRILERHTRHTETALNCSYSVRRPGSLLSLRSHCLNCALLQGPCVSSCTQSEHCISTLTCNRTSVCWRRT